MVRTYTNSSFFYQSARASSCFDYFYFVKIKIISREGDRLVFYFNRYLSTPMIWNLTHVCVRSHAGFVYCKFTEANRLVLVEIYFNGIEFHQLVRSFTSHHLFSLLFSYLEVYCLWLLLEWWWSLGGPVAENKFLFILLIWYVWAEMNSFIMSLNHSITHSS